LEQSSNERLLVYLPPSFERIHFVELQKTKAENENSWSVDLTSIDAATYDLIAKNPNKKEEAALRSPQAILAEMKALDEGSAKILNSILELI
jgi:type I restriction enzyme M protein